jgi:hypothetical protein
MADNAQTFLNALFVLDALDRTRGELEYSTAAKIASSINRRWLSESEPQWSPTAIGRYAIALENYGFVKMTKLPKNPRASMGTTNLMLTGPQAIWITDIGRKRLEILRSNLL